jgi:hypothetical protein
MWLFPRSKISKDVQLAREFGSFPCSWFPLRSNVCKPQLLGNVLEIAPVRLFLLRFSTPRVLLISIKHWGIMPLKELLDKSRARRFLALHIDLGILP